LPALLPRIRSQLSDTNLIIQDLSSIQADTAAKLALSIELTDALVILQVETPANDQKRYYMKAGAFIQGKEDEG